MKRRGPGDEPAPRGASGHGVPGWREGRGEGSIDGRAARRGRAATLIAAADGLRDRGGVTMRARAVPGTLADPETLAARAALRGGAHVRALEAFAADLRARHGAVPDADPADGGVEARLLVLLETPGPGAEPLRFVSRDNATGTAANLRRFFDAAGLDRRDSLLWNAVPWVIHAPSARNRPLRRPEIAAGLRELPALLDLLPRLRAVVLAGRVAAEARAVVGEVRPSLPVLLMPHPSPTIVCTSPDIPARILATLRAAARIVA